MESNKDRLFDASYSWYPGNGKEAVCSDVYRTKRRLHLALALIGDPDIIFLDEPTAELDYVVKHWNSPWICCRSEWLQHKGGTRYVI